MEQLIQRTWRSRYIHFRFFFSSDVLCHGPVVCMPTSSYSTSCSTNAVSSLVSLQKEFAMQIFHLKASKGSLRTMETSAIQAHSKSQLKCQRNTPWSSAQLGKSSCSWPQFWALLSRVVFEIPGFHLSVGLAFLGSWSLNTGLTHKCVRPLLKWINDTLNGVFFFLFFFLDF